MNHVYRLYTEKRTGFDVEAQGLARELRGDLGVAGLKSLRVLCRYDAEGLGAEEYAAARTTVFSEPPCDDCYDEAMPPIPADARVLAVEALPGQFDQRADSCAQCIAILTAGERPRVRAAKVYIFEFEENPTDEEFARIKTRLINPVEAREASLYKPETLAEDYGSPADVAVLAGFVSMDRAALDAMCDEYGLAMDERDLAFLQAYFRDEEKRDPTLTELRVLDTYWSDHCRHTTFGTHLKDVKLYDPAVAKSYEEYLAARREVYGEEKAARRPVTLMDVATAGVKVLKKRGKLPRLDESEEINACSVHVDAMVGGKKIDTLLQFKNETHNHPTEIEPFGGAATCLGGAIRDPLSGRAYVYQAMRVTGAGDPRKPLSETIPGKLPQKRLTRTAAAGYSSYGNQIGLATGQVRELYHEGYVAKHLEIGAVLGYAPYAHVVREEPAPGDVVILLGGRTGRDGCGGATGSSKAHTEKSLATCFAEVQKGNPPEERKIQRLFRDGDVTRMIKRCNDFGAGGVSVAIGELADGLRINLDLVPKKYEGLDGTELAISESQERMAVVVARENTEKFMAAAARENLESTVVAEVTAEPRLVMTWRGRTLVDISRAFLATNGASREANAAVKTQGIPERLTVSGSAAEKFRALLSDLNVCSQRGLGERFDGSIGASSVLAPYGGKTGLSPAPLMVSKLPFLGADCTTFSGMSYGGDPHVLEQNPYLGAAYAVVTSVSKLIAAGFDYRDAYLTLQEYFPKLGDDPERWGLPFSALLGAFSAQVGLGIAAIGGKDSMSGSYRDLDVPPTLVSFAVASSNAGGCILPDFQRAGHAVYLIAAPQNADGTPDYAGTLAAWDTLLSNRAHILSARATEAGGIAEAVFKLAIGNKVGFAAASDLFAAVSPGSIVAEADAEIPGAVLPCAVLLGHTTSEETIVADGEMLSLDELTAVWEAPLERVFPTRTADAGDAPLITCTARNLAKPAILINRPKAVIPVFPGTNCEYDTAKAVERAGGEAKIVVVRNMTADALAESMEEMKKALSGTEMLIFPGGFSGGDEPDGSGKFIAAYFRNPVLEDAVHALLDRDGLILGICNGFQALIKLGLVPFGRIRPMDRTCPTLTYNNIGRHEARYVTTRVASVKSPWLSLCDAGELHAVPISHGEGRFVADAATLRALRENGQIAFQYADAAGVPTMDIACNPNGSAWAIEGITSPDGRILGKMAHTERAGANVGVNIAGKRYQPIFEGGVRYFR
ncbi:MAG: phosphoribosylformylglycinamidine synthase [Clostridiaceae bacterium]|nr:phosphoribosylformylglycinamidine synthase [Clostridiaceae bacterium]